MVFLIYFSCAKKVYSTVNFIMVETYWSIGKQIFEAQGENERAEYGAGLLKYLSGKLKDEAFMSHSSFS